MSYTKNTWVDQVGQVRYTETEDDGYKIFTANYEEVTTLGTPVNATNMNHIEDGIKDCDTAVTNLGTQVNTLSNNVSTLSGRVTTLDGNVTTLNNSVVKLTGNQTISGTKTFNSAPLVPNSTATGTALALRDRASYGVKLGDGTIINWGNKSTPSRSNKYTIDFAIDFSNTNYGLTLTPVYSSGWGTVTPCVTTKNTGSAIIMGDDNRTISWIAIGR